MGKSVGTVKWFNPEKRYGFLVNEAGEEVFVYYQSIIQEGFKNLQPGQRVRFIQTRNEKGLQADEVEVV